MHLGISEPLSSLVTKRFHSAKETGALVFSATHLTTLHAGGISYQLRYCPALAKKPIANKENNGNDDDEKLNSNKKPKAKPPKPDPFENPLPDLLVAEIPHSTSTRTHTHLLVLNKYPVIPNHFILATKTWKAQADLLEKDDLEATYACLRAWEDEGEQQHHNGTNTQKSRDSKKRLFAFFNSGPDSGASQSHRHLQFLPVEAMREAGEIDNAEQNEATTVKMRSWEPLIDLVPSSSSSSPPLANSDGESQPYRPLPSFPILHFASPIPPNPSGDSLRSIYLSLYTAALNATKPSIAPERETKANSDPRSGSGPAAISYNLAMTTSTMLLCPRRSEHARIPVDANTMQHVAEAGVLSLNGTILAGTMMVKAEAEWDQLRRDPGRLIDVLGQIGYSRGGDREGEVGCGQALL